MHRPLLTIAIPTLRRLAYLREAVSSALEQDYEQFEILVSNDGRDPAIRDYMVGVTRGDGRVRYLETTGGLGLSGNWNWCAKHAAGTHLVIIGDDDRLLPAFLSSLAPNAARHDVVFCNHYLIDERGERRADTDEQLRIYGRAELPKGRVVEGERVAWMNAVAPSATLVRTALVRTLGFNPALNTPELEFYVRAARSGASFYFDNRYLSEYRTHSTSETARGLWHDRLLFALQEVEATSPAAIVARHAQLRRVARTAVMESLVAGRVEIAQAIVKTGLVQPAWLRVAASFAARSGPELAPRVVAIARAIKRLFTKLAGSARRLRTGPQRC